MQQALIEAYRILFESEPMGEHWQTAKLVLEELTDPRIGDELAKRCVCAIVNHISFPDEATRISLVHWAEETAVQLWPGLLPDEPHMDQIAWLEDHAT